MSLPMLHEVPYPAFGDQIQAIIEPDGEQYVVVNRICENLGVSFQGQNTKLKNARWSGLKIIFTPDERGRSQEHTAIPIKRLPMWLVSIHPGKVRSELRGKLEAYQAEAADVLARYFTGKGGLTAMGWETAFKAQTALIDQMQGQLAALSAEVQRLANPIDVQLARPSPTVPPGYFRLMKWAEMHHIWIAQTNQGAQGMIVADIARRSGVVPVFAKPPGSKRPGNYWPRFVLSKWMQRYYIENPACRRQLILFSVD